MKENEGERSRMKNEEGGIRNKECRMAIEERKMKDD